jgi:dUTPase
VANFGRVRRGGGMRAEVILSKHIKGIIDRDYRGYEPGTSFKKLDYYTCSLRTALRAIRDGMKIARQECGVTVRRQTINQVRQKSKS